MKKPQMQSLLYLTESAKGNTGYLTKMNLRLWMFLLCGLLLPVFETEGFAGESQLYKFAGESQLYKNDVRIGNSSAGHITSEVIGFSQTASWFLPEFESHPQIEDERWQLLWKSGSSVERWGHPDFDGWSNPIISPARETTVTRVIFCISGAGRSREQWAADIQAAVNTIRLKRPHVQEIFLEPVAGGPDHAICQFDGQNIRASVNHPAIDLAIADVVAVDPITRIGLSPTVDDCTQYSDALGHLTAAGQAAVGAKMGDFYSTLPTFAAAELQWTLYY